MAGAFLPGIGYGVAASRGRRAPNFDPVYRAWALELAGISLPIPTPPVTVVTEIALYARTVVLGL